MACVAKSLFLAHHVTKLKVVSGRHMPSRAERRKAQIGGVARA